MLGCSDLFRLVQTCSDLFRFVQTCSDLFRFVQICSDFVQTAGRTENQGARGVAGGEAGGVGVANEPKQEEGVGGGEEVSENRPEISQSVC